MALWHIHIPISGERSGRKKTQAIWEPQFTTFFSPKEKMQEGVAKVVGRLSCVEGTVRLRPPPPWPPVTIYKNLTPSQKRLMRSRVRTFELYALYDHFPKCQSVQINRASRGITLKITDAPWNRGDASSCIAQRIYLDVYKRSMHKWLICAPPLGYEGNPATLIHLLFNEWSE